MLCVSNTDINNMPSPFISTSDVLSKYLQIKHKEKIAKKNPTYEKLHKHISNQLGVVPAGKFVIGRFKMEPVKYI